VCVCVCVCTCICICAYLLHSSSHDFANNLFLIVVCSSTTLLRKSLNPLARSSEWVSTHTEVEHGGFMNIRECALFAYTGLHADVCRVRDCDDCLSR
jgi:hypothetical protein